MYRPKSQTLNQVPHGLSWLEQIADMTNKSSLLGQAISAMSLATVGRVFNDEHLKKESFRLYGTALQEARIPRLDHHSKL